MNQLPDNQRVVVTGLGALHNLGHNVPDLWASLTAGKPGIHRVTRFDTTLFATQIASEINGWNVEEHMDPKEARRNDRYTHYGIGAGKEALKDSGLDMNRENPDRVGVLIGSGIGGMETYETQLKRYFDGGPRKVSPFTIPALISNMCSGLFAIEIGARGPNYGIVSACATGTHSIGEAMHTLRRGDADVMIAGGAEAPITPFAFAGFCNMKAMSTRNDTPETACRPFSLGRDGFIMGEGAGVLVLETLEHAKKRNAPIHAEVLAYAATADAHHITMPDPEGKGLGAAMTRALAAARLNPSDVDYINAHGTSTPYNDKFETLGIKRVFGDHAKKLAVSSTKSMTGHLLGAAGGIESVISIKTIETQTIAPTINLHEPDPELDLDYVPNAARQAAVNVVLSNNLGFGGQNASILFRRFV
ncbi:MAG: beta-ketoacyl-ACP synthase II [Opitutaceae bacterium]|jgi:3-oxoacyl-[acyl-carrier-protein] synthase II|nr:beta-ketoacyl-ACP synthase II [Opitutaceae bacterium]